MKKSVIITLLIIALLLSLTGCSGGATPDSSSPDAADQPIDIQRYLVSSVKTYQKDASTGDWTLQNTVTIEYENAYPVMFTAQAADDQEHPVITTCEYTFDGDLPLTRIETDHITKDETMAEYQNGKLYNVDFKAGNKGISTKSMYQYGNDDEYFTLALTETHEAASGEDPACTNEEVDSVTVTTQNGLLQSTANSGVYANWVDGDKKEWQRLRGVHTAEYDGDGIVTALSDDFGKDGKTIGNRFIVTRDGGRITEVVEQIPDEEESRTDLTKYEFEYNDTEITPARYCLMMNWFIVGNQNSYYHYNWY